MFLWIPPDGIHPSNIVIRGSFLKNRNCYMEEETELDNWYFCYELAKGERLTSLHRPYKTPTLGDVIAVGLQGNLHLRTKPRLVHFEAAKIVQILNTKRYLIQYQKEGEDYGIVSPDSIFGYYSPLINRSFDK